MKSKYKKKYCKSLIDHMAKGCSYTGWGALQTFYVGQRTMYDWEKAYPEWLEAKEIGYQAGLLYYEQLMANAVIGIMPQQLKDINSKGVNIGVVMFVLRTRFHKEYTERQHVDHLEDDSKIVINFIKSKK